MPRVACLTLFLVLAPAVRAGEPDGFWRNLFCPGRLTLPTCCPDDYCRKPGPCLPPAFCPCGRDDYCAKPPPCLPPAFWPCGCDDYSPKPLPELSRAPGKCYPTDGAGPPPKCWWLRSPWWGKRLCRD